MNCPFFYVDLSWEISDHAVGGSRLRVAAVRNCEAQSCLLGFSTVAFGFCFGCRMTSRLRKLADWIVPTGEDNSAAALFFW